METLIESTKRFEKDLNKLDSLDKNLVIEAINNCVISVEKKGIYSSPKLVGLKIPSHVQGYESSLYMLRVTQKKRVILSIDEDPIFGQIIFTLFRVFTVDKIQENINGFVESMYQDLREESEEAQLIT
ncbi:hypothetical protein J0895_15400 [Phormidium pseudopriestleyi FRX01]|uniref:Uncharacterized protein n=1 Tax=Phormidium pseudopriestleyi FRX01 TaxID=1759528 RepID=A0ABS3FTK6_9CYAN|nr:hypothetical protein [Phormidium pseudopriestleyi]MBO0350455.1 hypothetical protein [Phormidium pseudopriestleyi FRX01]